LIKERPFWIEKSTWKVKKMQNKNKEGEEQNKNKEGRERGERERESEREKY
jgi:hypothetical protein